MGTFKVFQEVRCVAYINVDASNLDEATDIVWDGILRPTKLICSNENISVEYLPPFMIDAWTNDSKMKSRNQAYVGVNCSFRVEYIVDASSEEDATEMVKECGISVNEWEYNATGERVECISKIFPLNITEIKRVAD